MSDYVRVEGREKEEEDAGHKNHKQINYFDIFRQQLRRGLEIWHESSEEAHSLARPSCKIQINV